MAAEDSFTFVQNDLAETLFPVFEEIKRRNKLCDVTLKVHFTCTYRNSIYYKMHIEKFVPNFVVYSNR